MKTLAEVREAALSLPYLDRATLAEEILDTLPEPPAIEEAEFIRRVKE